MSTFEPFQKNSDNVIRHCSIIFKLRQDGSVLLQLSEPKSGAVGCPIRYYFIQLRYFQDVYNASRSNILFDYGWPDSENIHSLDYANRQLLIFRTIKYHLLRDEAFQKTWREDSCDNSGVVASINGCFPARVWPKSSEGGESLRYDCGNKSEQRWMRLLIDEARVVENDPSDKHYWSTGCLEIVLGSASFLTDETQISCSISISGRTDDFTDYPSKRPRTMLTDECEDQNQADIDTLGFQEYRVIAYTKDILRINPNLEKEIRRLKLAYSGLPYLLRAKIHFTPIHSLVSFSL
ncbi:hypothetical protein FFLO_05779 [Filobasidium floriforme]|uniref:Uncharacterized protein n=1 Tax=Filobasidium floriforme TaxID=5210 RepID=A0A8K0JG82_9TREE|nr:uncharacterized protein HD553DRAFT_322811 [Filobasidium floriforme]KAG7529138.1 hypothetical protein FFLO_05779 [Filobasidium floriforme]KAH8087305.1 hypothetical protein HD553DRAFT_322811 [Filobasidium floriforme]